MRNNKTARYQFWPESEAGSVALEQCTILLRGLFAGWPRRSRTMLVMGAGSGNFIEQLWEAGFEITGQEDDPEFLAQAKARMGPRVEFVLSAPDHLPFDDCTFDYAVIVAAYEFWDTPEAVLKEIKRVACGGVILIFPNAWSLFGFECRLSRNNPLCVSTEPLLQSPRTIWQLSRRIFGKKRIVWASVLPATTHTWKGHPFFRFLNSVQAPLPLGAFAGLRIDLGPMYAGAPLLLKTSRPVASTE
jgi:SAM-dependent methyltransferase